MLGLFGHFPPPSFAPGGDRFTRQSEEANRFYTEPRCVEGN
jgi:hypothetical protein